MFITEKDQADLRRIEKEVLADCEKGNIPLLHDDTWTFSNARVVFDGNILDSDYTITFQGESLDKKSSKQKLEELMKSYNDMLNEKDKG